MVTTATARLVDLRQELGDGRQYGYSLDDIKKNHVERYRWAAAQICRDDFVLDAGCGIGYGTHILAQSARHVRGIEFEPRIVEFARENWQAIHMSFHVGDLHTYSDLSAVDIVVAFEVLEHLVCPEIFLARASAAGVKKLFCSVPNLNISSTRLDKNPFHVQHFTPDGFNTLLTESGWSVQWMESQDFSSVRAGTDGRNLVAHATPGTMTLNFSKLEFELPTRIMAEMTKRSQIIRYLLDGKQ